MKKLQFLSFLFAALFMVTFTSCDKDDDEDADPSNQALLTAGVWTGDKIYYQGQDITEDMEEFLDVKNASIRFNANGSYTQTIDGDSFQGTWEFADNETKILMDEGEDEELLVDINKLTSTELYTEGDFFLTGDPENRFEIRFKR